MKIFGEKTTKTEQKSCQEDNKNTHKKFVREYHSHCCKNYYVLELCPCLFRIEAWTSMSNGHILPFFFD
jgi:hypothetical protein